MASKQRDRAVQRLEAALVEQARLGERFEAAVGMSTEFGAYARLRAAGDQAKALASWLNWLDDEGYRGLNAGPFELLAEGRANSLSERELEGGDHDVHRATPAGTGAAQRRGELPRADGDRQVGQSVTARRDLAAQRVGSRAWQSGRVAGSADRRRMHL